VLKFQPVAQQLANINFSGYFLPHFL